MPHDNPIPELRKIRDRVNAGTLPKAALVFADGAMTTASGILATIDEMTQNDQDAPTAAQAEALQRIYIGACRWLHINPILP